MTRYGWEIVVPDSTPGYEFACAVAPCESIAATMESLHKDDPVWRKKPRIRPLREPVEGYDKDAQPGGLRIRYYTPRGYY